MMADVCIIYARDDASHLPRVLEELLSPEFSVWWDKKISHGDYREEILRQLSRAGCVVPIWSTAASKSMIVEEAESARDHQIPLLPLLIHPGRAPLGFGRDQMTEAIGWNGEKDCAAICEHIEKIRCVIAQRRGRKHRSTDLVPGKNVKVPSYFFSLSSYETKITPEQGIRALDALNVNSILVSAQDTAQKSAGTRFIAGLKRISQSDGFVLLDSGNYEEGRITKLRRRPIASTSSMAPEWSLDKYRAALATTPHNMAFCFDTIKPPPNDVNKVVANAVKAVKRDQAYSDHPVLPIVHLPYDGQGNVLAYHAPEVMVRVAETLNPPIIGIPERELGDGIIARLATMKRIRSALDERYHYQPVHVLGTGDPISLALLSAAGADSFDGLEWCRFVLDADSARLYPIQDYDLFRWQDETSPYIEAMSDDDETPHLTWLGRVAVHNIEFYLTWMAMLREALEDEKRFVQFITNLLPKGGMADIWPVLWGNEE